MNNLIILDRDGVINQDSLHYIKSVDEFILLPGSIEAIAKLTAANYRIAVATNQSGLSRGLYNQDELSKIHEKLIKAVKTAGGEIEIIEYCPHLPAENCFCRKPQPGMLLTIAKYFNCTLQNVPFIGDRITDIKAAELVGALPIVINSPMTNQDELQIYPHVPVFPTLAECVHTLFGS